MSPFCPQPLFSTPDTAFPVPPNAASPTLADVFRRYGDAYLATYAITPHQRQVMDAIRHCRTFALGYHVDVCTHCGHTEIHPNSCGNRHCPACQGKKRMEWVEARMQDLLPVPYYHVVFTLPDRIYPFCLYNQQVVYDLLFHSAAETLKTFGRDPQWLGAEQMGFFGVLHTWGQTLSCHPHVHFVVPAGGVDAHGEWVWPTQATHNFLFPVHAVAQVFRGKFIAGLKQAYRKGTFQFPGQLAALETDEAFEAWLDALVSNNWVVYAKAPFGGPEQVVKYVSRYTHRVAISNQRILSIENGRVRFTYKNYRNKDNCETAEDLWEEMALSAEEFIRRFLQHVLPSGYHRIRYYGFLRGNQHECVQTLRDDMTRARPDDRPAGEASSWPGPSCPVCEEGTLTVMLIVDARGRVVYHARPCLSGACGPIPVLRMVPVPWDTS